MIRSNDMITASEVYSPGHAQRSPLAGRRGAALRSCAGRSSRRRPHCHRRPAASLLRGRPPLHPEPTRAPLVSGARGQGQKGQCGQSNKSFTFQSRESGSAFVKPVCGILGSPLQTPRRLQRATPHHMRLLATGSGGGRGEVVILRT